ncbi:hypothetical protein E1A91_A06G077800v1 [Gossypium mustelinum]|uniref:Uncharacterized protein n=1 Tax=Gossypium mustelinum TaxID=34275 RepID=A0A5D2YUN5_GOSMU|nr:hypothetical protein E1A91_A06G077800v1 [Gossypium mustelinum]
MAILGLQLQQRFPVLTGVCYSRLISATIHAPAVASVSSLSCKLKKWNNGGRLPRRLVVGLGASFWAQYMNMASNSKSFIASARLKGAVEQALQNVEWPEQFPFKDEDFQRFNETPDSLFYEAPRFVTHIDVAAIAALTKYYSEVFPPSNTPGVSILDMCSSWVSHFPKGYKQERVVGMGMNEEELKRNPAVDISPNPGRSDPMYIVFSRKLSTA